MSVESSVTQVHTIVQMYLFTYKMTSKSLDHIPQYKCLAIKIHKTAVITYCTARFSGSISFIEYVTAD